MPNSCFVPGCTSGYPSTVKKNKHERMKNPSSFGSPLNPIVFQEWKRKIPRLYEKFTAKDHVCELHFTEECIERFLTLPLTYGKVEYRPRKHPVLKPLAVPTIFPDCSSCMSMKPKLRKSP